MSVTPGQVYQMQQAVRRQATDRVRVVFRSDLPVDDNMGGSSYTYTDAEKDSACFVRRLSYREAMIGSAMQTVLTDSFVFPVGEIVPRKFDRVRHKGSEYEVHEILGDGSTVQTDTTALASEAK